MATHPPPPYLTGKHSILFKALLVGLYVNASLADDPEYQQDSERILAILDQELEVLHYASDPEASAGQLLAAFYYVCDTMAWSHDRNELPF
jgi:hypothetical protein